MQEIDHKAYIAGRRSAHVRIQDVPNMPADEQRIIFYRGRADKQEELAVVQAAWRASIAKCWRIG
jgi:hypothetical protein